MSLALSKKPLGASGRVRVEASKWPFHRVRHTNLLEESEALVATWAFQLGPVGSVWEEHLLHEILGRIWPYLWLLQTCRYGWNPWTSVRWKNEDQVCRGVGESLLLRDLFFLWSKGYLAWMVAVEYVLGAHRFPFLHFHLNHCCSLLGIHKWDVGKAEICPCW